MEGWRWHQAASEGAEAHTETGTAPFVTRSISEAFSHDGRAPFSHLWTVGCFTPTAEAKSAWLMLELLRYAARVIMGALYAQRI